MRSILIALLSIPVSARPPRSGWQAERNQLQHIGVPDIPGTGTTQIPFRPKTTEAESRETDGVNAKVPQGEQSDEGNMMPRRTATSTRTITLIIATATPLPDLSTDLDVGKLGPAGNEAEHDKIVKIVQIGPGRMVTNMPNAAQTARPVQLLVGSEQDNDDSEIEKPSYNVRSALLRQAVKVTGRQQGISEGAIWFFLASFGVFMTGVVWNVYVHIGLERERRLAQGLAMSDQELGKGRVAFDDAVDHTKLTSVVPAVERVPRSLV